MNKETEIILLHGWGQTKASLSCLETNLKTYGTVNNYDLLGHGENKTNSVLRLDDYIEQLNNLAKGNNDVVLIGHSFGGKIASFYALKHKIKALILIAPSTYHKTPAKVKIKIKLKKLFRKSKFLKGSKDYAKLSNNEKQTFINILRYLNKNELKKIKCPTLIFGFDKDKEVKKKDILPLAKYIPNSKTYILKGDHFSYFEHQHEISLKIGEFLNAL